VTAIGAAGLRATTEALCEEMFRAGQDCLGRWLCRLVPGRTLPSPEEVIASQEPVHQAAGKLREWCLAGPQQAEAERQKLMRVQAAGEASYRAAIQAHRGADRWAIRRQWVHDCFPLWSFRDAITVGLGWPHRGERVTVTARYSQGSHAGQIAAEGPAIYLDSHGTFNHQVWMPQVSANPHAPMLMVTWQPRHSGSPLGNADPAGDIAMRVLGAESRPLPAPLPTWPEPGDAGDISALLHLPVDPGPLIADWCGRCGGPHDVQDCPRTGGPAPRPGRSRRPTGPPPGPDSPLTLF
jgi:hypothetical protein